MSSKHVLITHRLSGGDYHGHNVSDVRAIESDDDTRGVTISEGFFEIDEGETDTYTIKLNSAPTGTNPVFIGISSDNTLAATVPLGFFFGAEADLTDADPANHIYQWDDPQTVTVTAPENDIDHIDQLIANITHSITPSADNDYSLLEANIPIDDVFVRALDEDDMRAVYIGPTQLTVTEGGPASGWTRARQPMRLLWIPGQRASR